MQKLFRKSCAALALMSCFGAGHSALAEESAPTVKTAGTLTVAVYNDFAPFSDHNAGIDIDIAKALAAKMGLQLSLLPFPAGDDVNDDLRNMVWKGHYMGYGPADVMMHVPIDPALTAHNDKVAFFGSYLRETVRLVRNLSQLPTYSNLDSLTGLKIGVDKASIGAVLLLGAEDGKFREDVKIYASATEALEKLKAGEVAGVIANEAEIESVLKQDARFQMGDISFPMLPRNGWIVGMAVKKDNPELKDALTEATAQLIASGEMAKIFAGHDVKMVQP